MSATARELEPGDLVLTVTRRAARVVRVDRNLHEAIVERLDDRERACFRMNHLEFCEEREISMVELTGEQLAAHLLVGSALVLDAWIERQNPQFAARMKKALASGTAQVHVQLNLGDETMDFVLHNDEGRETRLFGTVLKPKSPPELPPA